MEEQTIFCHDCGLPNLVGDVPAGAAARCPRCAGVLLRRVPNSIDRTLACAVAGLVLILVANAFPFLTVKIPGNVTVITLATGVRSLFDNGRPLVGSLVFLTTMLAPFLHILALLYVVGSIRLDIRSPGLAFVFRTLRRIQTWSMMEVYMISILVSLTKLAEMGRITPGIALWSFVALIPMMAGANASLDPHLVWNRIGRTA